jgi:thiol-disulfide isomerase/thioredoxin
MEPTNSNPESKKAKKKINPNVFLVVIGIALGVLIAGSFGINFFNKEMCPKVLGEADIKIFEEDGVTWVAYDQPIVNVTVISDKNCDTCNYDEIVKMLKANLTPTLKINAIEFDSSEGEQLINSFGIKSIPAFVFDSKITETENYEKAAQVFVEKDGQYFLDSVKVGLPVGRNLESIEAGENDAFKGPVDAKVTIIEFSEFQCPYCKKGKETASEILEIYGEQVKLVFKHFPLTSIHPEAQKAAEATECAGDQGKFWEMHDWMFDNQQELAVDGLKTAATTLGMNSSEFNNCLDWKI